MESDHENCSNCGDLERQLAEAEDRIDTLERDNEKLLDRNSELRASLDAHRGEAERLAEAADMMADLGRIHNTPASKRAWIAGR